MEAINPAAPSPFTDGRDNLTIPARSLMNALTRGYNFAAQSGVAGPVTITLFGPTTNGSLTIENGVITGVVAPT